MRFVHSHAARTKPSWTYLGQPKVQNLGVSPLGDEDIPRLDVAMNNAFAVGSIQPVGNLNRQTQQRVGIQGPSRDAMHQGHAVQKFHDDEGPPVVVPNLIDGANIGMIQCGSCLRLPLEPGKRLRVSG